MSALAGAGTVALFVAGALLVGERPPFDAGGAELAAYLDDNRTRVQIGCALFALATPLLVWFLATVRAKAPPAARPAATVALACGAVFAALFLADVTALAVSALRPENMAAEPELATALRDFELLAMGMAAPMMVTMLGAFAVLVSRAGEPWPRWLGVAAAVAAAAYALRLGTLFTTDGAFAADGVLGIYVPVAAVLGWLLAASLTLTRRLR